MLTPEQRELLKNFLSWFAEHSDDPVREAELDGIVEKYGDDHEGLVEAVIDKFETETRP